MEGIVKWIEKRAETAPERTALIGERRELNYRDMSREINQTARLLSDQHAVKKGERIAILAGNGVEYMVLLFAIAKLGAIAVVLNTRLTAPELTFQLNDSGAGLLVAEGCYRELGTQLVAGSGLADVLWFDPHGLTAERLEDRISECEGTFGETGADASLPFIICYTSGTTGRPKGAVLTQENMFWNAVNNCLGLDITSADRIMALLPLFHIGGIGLFSLPALFAGGCVILPDRFEPERVLKMIEEHRVTIALGVPTMHDLLRKSPAFEGTDLSSLRWLYNGGAPCPHELITYYLDRGIPFGQGYGMTETSPTVFLLSKEDYTKKVGSIGKPVLYCDIRIVDDEGRDVKAGEIGELLVRGPHVMQGYWNLPEETNKALRDGWLSTGDLVRADENGFVYVAGRKKEMIISGGENVYPLEIEQVIRELPSVDEAAVVGVVDLKWGEVPAAAVVLKERSPEDEGEAETSQEQSRLEEVQSHCMRRLAKYKVPATIVFVSALPKNATGKVDKNQIKIMLEKRMEENRHGDICNRPEGQLQ
ncbi:AMP-binding protein [Brevibacillus ruminantium]|uniref:AMP-binding protein n=1 Tax=Brevibacillus ruminantium TaxID=2950604 RepID=A0ABY4WEK9_9BACL|nr:AMP-binding protein [Brevibacillus ruminantium]USG64210.1 AMP-binding protein [Brevibacillus ruminantium]